MAKKKKKSFQQILQESIDNIIKNTGVTDLEVGSALAEVLKGVEDDGHRTKLLAILCRLDPRFRKHWPHPWPAPSIVIT